MTTKTLREQEVDRQERLDGLRRRLPEWRMRAWHAAPSGQWVDVDHLVADLGAGGGTNRHEVAVRHVLAHLVPAGSAAVDVVARGFSETPEQLRAWAGQPLWWPVPDELLADVPEEVRSLVVGARPQL